MKGKILSTAVAVFRDERVNDMWGSFSATVIFVTCPDHFQLML